MFSATIIFESLSVLWHEKGETCYLFRNLWSLTPHYLTAESSQAARRPISLRRFVTRGLAALHPFSDALAECLHQWRDCQSYLSQLCLEIGLAAPSVAFSFYSQRQMVPVQPFIYLFLLNYFPSLDGCLASPFLTLLGSWGPHTRGVPPTEPIRGTYLQGDSNDLGWVKYGVKAATWWPEDLN